MTLLTIGICSLGKIGRSVRESQPVPVVETPASVAAPVSNPITEKTVQFAGGCNLRREASQTSEKMGFASKMTVYEVTDQNGKWRKIHVDGTVGWVGCDSFEERVKQLKVEMNNPPVEKKTVVDPSLEEGD